VTAEDLEAARIRAKGFFTEDLMCPKGQSTKSLRSSPLRGGRSREAGRELRGQG
jgi:hypothetical protein